LDIPDFKLAAILHTFEKTGLVFNEDNHYLSLPLQNKPIICEKPKKRVTAISS
jgi:hypothetical protein